MHAERGVDTVPITYVVDDDNYVGVPVDRVKPKASPHCCGISAQTAA